LYIFLELILENVYFRVKRQTKTLFPTAWKFDKLEFGVLIVFCFFLLLSPAMAAEKENPISYPITVSATVGEPKLTVFGYTSPQALVELRGQRVAENVIADQQGYFFFDRVFLPRPTTHLAGGHSPTSGEFAYPEVCLTTIDRQSRLSSFPTCLPPLPTGPFEITVGPVLMPPTIYLEKGRFLTGKQVSAQGLTIPNAEVIIFLANKPDSQPALIPPAHALGDGPSGRAHFLPSYKVRSDKNGYFEFNLPSIQPANWRIFASATFLDAPTPKSNTLIFNVLKLWQWWWYQLLTALKQLFSLFKPYLWILIVLAQIFIIFILFKQRRRSTEIEPNSLGQGFISRSRLDEEISHS